MGLSELNSNYVTSVVTPIIYRFRVLRQVFFNYTLYYRLENTYSNDYFSESC